MTKIHFLLKSGFQFIAFFILLEVGYTLFCKQLFYKQRQAENGKNQANPKQHP